MRDGHLPPDAMGDYLEASMEYEAAAQSGDSARREAASRRLDEAGRAYGIEQRASLFEAMLRDPAVIQHLREHGSPEVRATIARLDGLVTVMPAKVWLNADGTTSPIVDGTASS